MITVHPEYVAQTAGIRDVPEDDLRREVFADWLEEHAGTVECGRCRGKKHEWETGAGFEYEVACRGCSGTGLVSNGAVERAEFIRVQCELAKRGCVDVWCEKISREKYPVGKLCELADGCDTLRRRERELLCSPHYDWLPQVPGWHGGWGITFGEHKYHAALISDSVPVTTIPVNFRRGFVAEVRCRLADWFGEERMETVTDMWGDSQPFMLLRTPGIGPRVVAEHPVELVRVTDKEPQGVYQYSWYNSHNPDGSHLESDLPDEVFRMFEGFSFESSSGWKDYPTREAADAALSAALLEWAKRQNGIVTKVNRQPVELISRDFRPMFE